MNVKNANQAKSVRVRLSIALHVLKDSLSGQTMSSRVKYDQIFSKHTYVYIRFKCLSFCKHQGDVEQWHPEFIHFSSIKAITTVSR